MVPKSSTNTIAAIFCRAFILFLEILFHSNPDPTRNRLVLVPSIVDFSQRQRPVGQPSLTGRSNFPRPAKSLYSLSEPRAIKKRAIRQLCLDRIPRFGESGM